MRRDPLEVDAQHVQHQVREHGVGGHEQRAEHHDEWRRDEEPAHDGRDVAPAADAAAVAARSRPDRFEQCIRGGGPRVQRTRYPRTHISDHTGAAHPRRGHTVGRQRERQRRATQREQLQWRCVTPHEPGREQYADRQPRDSLAIQPDARAPVQHERGERHRRDPQEHVQPRGAGSAQQHVAQHAEDQTGDQQRSHGNDSGAAGPLAGRPFAAGWAALGRLGHHHLTHTLRSRH